MLQHRARQFALRAADKLFTAGRHFPAGRTHKTGRAVRQLGERFAALVNVRRHAHSPQTRGDGPRHIFLHQRGFASLRAKWQHDRVSQFVAVQDRRAAGGPPHPGHACGGKARQIQRSSLW